MAASLQYFWEDTGEILYSCLRCSILFLCFKGIILCRVVVLNDYNVIREAFKEDAFCGRPDLKMLEVRNDGIRKGIFTRWRLFQI